MPVPVIKRDQQYIIDRVLVDKNGCWIWHKSIMANGYGQASGLGEYYAHRLAYRIFKGDIPRFKLICHSCDTRPCCNPEHLFVGTQDDNIADAISKGRIDPKAASARANSFHTTSPEIVEAIIKSYEEGVSVIELTETHKLSRTTIYTFIHRNQRKQTQHGST